MELSRVKALDRYYKWLKKMADKRKDKTKAKANRNKDAKYKKSAKGRLLAKKRRNKKTR